MHHRRCYLFDSSFRDGNWHLVHAVFEETDCTGVDEAGGSKSLHGGPSNGNPFTIGEFSSGMELFKGEIRRMCMRLEGDEPSTTLYLLIFIKTAIDLS